MHPFELIAGMSISSALADISAREELITIELQKSAQTVLVRGLQAQNLRRVILAVGIFSIFEAYIEDTVRSSRGFPGMKEFLLSRGNVELARRFETFFLAVNVLKHGRGRSYNILLQRTEELPFEIKRHGEKVFFEGDLSEVTGLIRVNDSFIYECVRVIGEVMTVLEQAGGEGPP